MCAYKEQYSRVSQQNIFNNFFFLFGKHISWCCVGDILSEERKIVSVYHHPYYNTNTDGGQSMEF
jgi:hypothetical protein